MSLEMTEDWGKVIREQLRERLISLICEVFGDTIAERLKENIKVEIAFGDFPTVGGNTMPDLLAWGDYFRSFSLDNKLIKTDGYEVSVGTDDPKSEDLEYGTWPAETDVDEKEIIKWAQHKKIQNPVNFGKWVTKMIKEFGQPPKRVITNSIIKTIRMGKIINEDTVNQLRKRKGGLPQ